MSLVPPVPMPKQDLRDWALKTANYLQLFEQAAKQPSPKIVQLERKQPSSKATTDGLLMFNSDVGALTYSFNKKWFTSIGADSAGNVSGGPYTFSGSIIISGGTPTLEFKETDAPAPAGMYRFSGASAGNFSLQRATAADWSTYANIWRYLYTSAVFNVTPPAQFDSTIECDGGSGWGLKITSGYPSIWFYDDNVGGAYQHLGLSAGNGWFRFYVSSDTGGSVTDIFTINPSGSIIGYVPGVFQKGMTLTSDAGVNWALRLQDGYPTILFEDTTPSGDQRLGVSGGNGAFRFGVSDAGGTITPWLQVYPDVTRVVNGGALEVTTYDVTSNRDASRMTPGALGLQANSSNGAATRFLAGYYGANNMTIEMRRSGSSYNATGTWGAISDERVKHNITDATPKLADLLKLRIVNYVLNSDPEQRKQIGVISQEAGQVFPGLVDPDEEGMETFKYSVLTPIIVKVIQEMCALLGITVDEDGNLQVAA